MRTNITIVALSFLLVWSVMAQEVTVAEWDFTKGVPSGEYGGKLRENGRLDKGGLLNLIQGDKAAGFATDKVYPELVPQQGSAIALS